MALTTLMKSTTILIISLFLFFFLHSPAQQAGYKLYTVADGLVQSEVTKLHQDRKGFLWIGTKSGISRFDGNLFQTIADSQGISKAWVLNIEDLNDSTIWILTARGTLLFTYGCTKTYLTSYPVDGHFPGFWSRDGKGFFITQSKEVLQIDHHGILKLNHTFIDRIIDLFCEDGSWNLTFSKRDGNFYFRARHGQLACFRNNKVVWLPVKSISTIMVGRDDRIYCLSPDQSINKYISEESPGNFSKSDLQQKEPSRLYAVSDTVITELYNFGMDPDIPTIPFFIQGRDSIFLSSRSAMMLRQVINQKMAGIRLPFTAANAILLDQEQNIWLGSPLGLLRLNSFSFTHYNSSDGLHQNIQVVTEDSKQNIIAGGFDDGIQKIKQGLISDIRTPSLFGSQKKQQIYPGCGRDQAGNIYISMNPACMMRWDGTTLWEIDGLPLTSSYSFFEDTGTHTQYIGTDLGLLKRNPAIPGYRMLKIFPGNRGNKVVSIMEAGSGRLLLGGFKGLSFLEGEKVTHLPNKEFPYSLGANAMSKDHRGNIWIGNADGLWIFDMKEFRKVLNPWFNDLVVSLCVIDSSKLFIGGVHGVGFLDLAAFWMNDSVNIRFFNGDNGFTGNECQQNAVCYDSRGILWVATTDNLQCIDPANLPSAGRPPKVYIGKISVFDETMKPVPRVNAAVTQGRLDLGHSENNIRIDFIAPVFRGPTFVRFRYQLEGQDKDWSPPTSERFAVYTNLSPGKYIFKVIACNDAAIWSDKPAVYEIVIHPAFWQTWWFLTLLILLMACFFFWSGYLVMSRRKKSMREKLESEKKIAELQLLAIRNQIDPHFTFNAINSIASVIMKDEKEKAYSFFVKLSNLIRQVLTSGDKVTRTLAEEINFVQNYLEIEKLRFRDSFRYQINLVQPVNLSQEVPKMVIHTYAENALKHGLLNKTDGPGELLITIRENGNRLHLEIEDNGIGREKAKELGEKSTGKGMMILNFYYDFFDRYNDQKIIHEVTDLMDEQSKPAGTRVTVIIPAGFNYKIIDNERDKIY
ncbi:MAG TPA: histidine kinase [Bacteroidales bacterium]|nr:histidine kinase [Bacteroidales bacterium]